MKKIGVLFLAASLIAVSAPAMAQRNTGMTAVASLIASYPAGGQGLVAEAERLCSTCEGAQALIAAAAKASVEQKTSIALGILRALKRADKENRDLASCIRQSLRNGDAGLAAIVAALASQQYAAGGDSDGGGFSGLAGRGTRPPPPPPLSGR